ncbi:MAG: type II toxin-antitoxin system RelE family toxin [Candidatus Binatia bacterium]
MPYEIKFADYVRSHFEALTAREHATLLDAIEKKLTHEPLVETRNRKPLRPNPVAPWELRVGPLRAFYEVAPRDPESETSTAVVRILAAGKKERNILRIAGEEITL